MSSRVLVVMVMGSSAFAQPRQPAKVPMKSVPCAPDGLTLHAAGDDPVVCWDKGCMKLDMLGGAVPHSRPPAAKAWQLPAAEGKADRVCLGTLCKKYGPKLAAAVAALTKDHDPQHDGPLALHATSDLKAIVVGQEVWSVPGDKRITFTRPNLYRRSQEKPATIGFTIAGDLIVVEWSTCAGPCTQFSIADSSGRPKGGEGEGGGGAFQLDAKRFVVAGEYGTFSIFDLGTGKPRGSIGKLAEDPSAVQSVRLDDTTIAVMYSKYSDRGFEIGTINSYDEKDSTPHLSQTTYLPKCTN